MFGNEFETPQRQEASEGRLSLRGRLLRSQDLVSIRDALEDVNYFGSNKANIPDLGDFGKRIHIPRIDGDIRAKDFLQRRFGGGRLPIIFVVGESAGIEEVVPEANFRTAMSDIADWYGSLVAKLSWESFVLNRVRLRADLYFLSKAMEINIDSLTEQSIKGRLDMKSEPNRVMIAATRWDLASPLVAFADLDPGWIERLSPPPTETVREPEIGHIGFGYAPGLRQSRPVVSMQEPYMEEAGKEEFPVEPIKTQKPVTPEAKSPYGYYASKEELDNAVSRAKSRASREAREEKDALYKGQRRRGTSGGIGADRITEILSGVTQSDGYGDTWKPNYSSGLPDEQKKDTNRPKSKFERKARQAAKKAAQKGKRK